MIEIAASTTAVHGPTIEGISPRHGTDRQIVAVTNTLAPQDHAEAVALFRAQVLGSVLNRDLHHGELLAELRVIAKHRFRPPGSHSTRTYSVPTLLRWHRAYKRLGLGGLRPTRRTKGDALSLSDEQRELVLEIRRQHPGVSARLVVSTLEDDGRLHAGQLTAQTLRRLYRREGLRRLRRRDKRVVGERHRWEASHVGELWHADVCHVSELVGGSTKVRIHALLDDKSRYIVAIRVLDHEREVGMLDLLLDAIRQYGAPRRLYLDNGSTYRGAALETACGRLGITLSHAQPYDPQARGKMERYWRTLREGGLDHMGKQPTLHDVQVRVSAFVDHYHKRPHASLVGRAPGQAWATRQLKRLDEDALTDALTVRAQRRVRTDCTLALGNVDWELRAGFLAGRIVTVARTLADAQQAPWVEHDGQRYALRPVDPVANGNMRKRRAPTPGVDAVDFDPINVLLDRYLGRKPQPRKDV